MEVDNTPTEDFGGPSTSIEDASKPNMCEVCNVKPMRYTCPRCEVKTCCLRCSQIHKLELECNGKRDLTKYIPISKFTNLDVSSDFRLLEEITRTIEKCKKDSSMFKRDGAHLPSHLFKLKKSSMARRTLLKFLPQTFERHRNNTTRLNFHKDVIFWRVDWVFLNADCLKLSDDLVRESEKVCSVFAKYLVKQEDAVLQEKLQYYQAADLPGIRFFIKAEGKPGKKFFELDATVSLRENLGGKTIIEYPTVYVVLKEHGDNMAVVDSDGEDENEGVVRKKEGNEVINGILKKSESDDSVYRCLENLLFIGDRSDGEMSN